MEDVIAWLREQATQDPRPAPRVAVMGDDGEKFGLWPMTYQHVWQNGWFERFFQVEEAAHHSKEGLGLGLYIARQIAEAHSGAIWYEPRKGGGSIFRFTVKTGREEQADTQ